MGIEKFFFNDKKGYIFIIIALILLTRFFFHFSNQKGSDYINGQEISFTAILTKEPKVSGAYQQFYAVNEKNDQFLIKTLKYPPYFYGQSLQITGRVTKQVLKNNKIVMTINYPQIKINQNSQILPLAVINNIRQRVASVFQKTLAPTSSSLLLGIVFGFKEEFSYQFGQVLRISGVTHVIAASGMNVTMVGAFLASIMSLFLKRQAALLFTILGIAFYATLAGLEPSIVRASIMGSLAFGAQILGRQALAAYLLFITGYVMLLINPGLITDIGFQLSFLSTLGLVLIRPLFEIGRLKTFVQKSIIGEDLTTTISAQISTMPVLFANFGTYSLWSVIANSLVLWTIPILMIFGGIAAIASFIFEPLAVFFLYLCLPFLLFFENVVIFFSKLPGLISVDITQSWALGLGYYLILSSIALSFYRRIDLRR